MSTTICNGGVLQTLICVVASLGLAAIADLCAVHAHDFHAALRLVHQGLPHIWGLIENDVWSCLAGSNGGCR